MPGGSAYKFLPSSGSQYQGGALPANTLVMLNSSGSTVAKYSVVIADTAITDNQAFTTSTAQDDHKVIGITLEAIPNGARGLVQTQGVVEKCRVAAGTDRYEYLRQSTTAGVADPTAAPTSGTFGRALTSRDADGYARVQIMHMHTGLGPDTTAPTLGLALCNGNSLRLFFDEALDAGSVPAVTAFAVVVAGGADVVTAVAVNGSVVRLTLTTAATNGQAVTVAYTKPGAGMLQDLAGNDVATFGATAAVNDTPATATDTTAPTVSHRRINGTVLTIWYDEALNTGSVPATTDFTVQYGGSGATVSSVGITGSLVLLTMAAAPGISQAVTVAYTAGANPVEDVAGNNAANYTAQTVTNTTGAIADVQTFTSSGTYTKPSGAKWVQVEIIAGGGGSGGGRGDNAGTSRSGGSGGGGGASATLIFNADALGATESVTVGGAGAAGTGGSSADGTDGGVGGNSSFGSWVTVYGGGGGKGGGSSGTSGGGGGGTAGAGQGGRAGANSNGGLPRTSAITQQNDMAGGGGAGGTTGGGGNNAENGGGSGGGTEAAGGGPYTGGSSLHGGGGGGGGGEVTSGNTEISGGAAGRSNTYVAGGGAAGGAINGGNGTAGTTVTAGSAAGGGGGGGQDSGTGGTGGTGGAPGGGGGGGGAGTTTGGAGAAGGRGEVRVTTWF